MPAVPDIQSQRVDSLALAVTRDGSWEILDGERIYEKEVIKDANNTGHTILKVRTFQKGTTILNKLKTVNLFDDAKSCIQYYNETLKDSPYYSEIAGITSKYDDKLKTFVPVIKDKYGDTYEQLFIAGFLMYGPMSKQPKK